MFSLLLLLHGARYRKGLVNLIPFRSFVEEPLLTIQRKTNRFATHHSSKYSRASHSLFRHFSSEPPYLYISIDMTTKLMLHSE